MFEVGLLRRVEIEVDGEKLTHYFDELRGDEWLEFQRKLCYLTADGDNAKRILAIYDARCKKVEGYTLNGVDLMSLPSPSGRGEGEGSDWRDFIPGDHKVAAWLELIAGADLKKKSSPSSAASPTRKKPAQEK